MAQRARRGTAKPGANGLDDTQLDELRADVAAGRFPRVAVVGTRSDGPASGTVRAVGDPAVDGDDFVTVRVKLNGVSDDLRFAPTELSRPARARRTKTTDAVVAIAVDAPAVPAAPAAKPARPRRGNSSAPVTVVLRSDRASWSVSVQRGARTVLKNTPVTPGAVSAIAALIGDAGVEDAVAGVNDAARDEAESRARELREELARVQAVLDSHRRP